MSAWAEIPALVCQCLRRAALLAGALASSLMAVAPCLAEGLVWPPITEPPTSHYVPGKWVWAELFTEDVSAAVRFYGKAFGWSFKEFPAERGRGYTLALSDVEPVGGMLQREHASEKQPGSRWLGMISVPDVKAAARYAADHGGKVVVSPRLLAGRGEVALLADPEGAPFGVIHSSSGDPPDYLAGDKQWVWIELWAKNPKAMADFYSGLAGYQLEPVQRPDGSLGYFLASGGYTRCGIIPSPVPSVAPAWLPYLRVEDVKAATKQAEEAGARVVVPPSAAVRDGRLALIVDPTGAALGLAELMQSETE
jgi:predicted enzyme related to lactoylglutathione lyase